MEHRDEGQAIDLHDDEHDSGEHVDASVYTLAAVFGAVAFPPGMPDYRKTAILDHAEQDKDAAGDFIIDNRINPDDPRRRQAMADADDDDNLSQLAQIVRQEHEEREREEWSRTKSTVAGVAMTGAEWARVADRLHNDEELRRRLIEVLEAKGATHDEAIDRVDRVATVADAAATPPTQRTKDQKDVLRQAESDASLRRDVQTVTSAMNDANLPRSALNSSFTSAVAGATPPPMLPPIRVAPPPVVAMNGPGF